MPTGRQSAASHVSGVRASMPARRQGGVYVAVLGVALIVSLIAMTSLHLARVETDVLTGAERMAQAELLSQSAVELALARMNADSNWRTNYGSGDVVPSSDWISLGTGSMRFMLQDGGDGDGDGDGDLSDDPRDIVTVRGIGRVGEATHVTTVLAEPDKPAEPADDPLDCLGVSMHAGGNVMPYGAATITVDRGLSSNGNITGGTIEGDASAMGSILQTVTVTGTRASDAPARDMPNEAEPEEPEKLGELWTYYLANGTAIDIASIEDQTIQGKVLSADSNPYGDRTKNPQGIYVIYTQGQTLHIRDSRIVATLVIIGPGATTEVESLIHWTAPATNFPALLVDGNLRMEWSGGSSLLESALDANFNPPGTPYDNEEDDDRTDSYPGLIKGLVYCRGNLTVTSPCVMKGVLVVGGTASLSSDLTVAHNAGHEKYPPPGFASGAVMRVIPRTWKRVAQ